MIIASTPSARASAPRLTPASPPPGVAAPAADSVTLGSPPRAEASARPEPSRPGRAALLGLAGLAALTVLGGVVAQAAAAELPARPVPTAAQPAATRLAPNPVSSRSVRTYIENMLENNRLQGETLNTYEKSFRNNWNTLVHIERRILTHPESLNDPTVRAVYERVQAALDTAQVFQDVEESVIYQAGYSSIELGDGTRMTIPRLPVDRTIRVRGDYSGAARMTDHTLESLRSLVQPRR